MKINKIKEVRNSSEGLRRKTQCLEQISRNSIKKKFTDPKPTLPHRRIHIHTPRAVIFSINVDLIVHNSLKLRLVIQQYHWLIIKI